MTTEILLAGFGGQGVLFAGKSSLTAVLWTLRSFRGSLRTVRK